MGRAKGAGPTRPHMNVLAELLHLKFVVHNVRTQLWSTTVSERESNQGSLFYLVYDGSHYELLHM